MAKTETATSAIHQALQNFADTVRSKSTTIATGKPEDQLRAPLEGLMRAVGIAQGWEVVPTGETRLPDSLGCPDCAIHKDKEITLELHPEQEKLLDKILAGGCFTIGELPDPLEEDHELGKPPKPSMESEEDNTLVRNLPPNYLPMNLILHHV